jgi:hypothetical protein
LKIKNLQIELEMNRLCMTWYVSGHKKCSFIAKRTLAVNAAMLTDGAAAAAAALASLSIVLTN